jgi:3-oxoacid CoA-transferase subunit B
MPLSGRARVNLAVTDVTPGSFLLRESAPGVSVDAVVTVAGAPLAVAMRTCPLPPRMVGSSSTPSA